MAGSGRIPVVPHGGVVLLFVGFVQKARAIHTDTVTVLKEATARQNQIDPPAQRHRRRTNGLQDPGLGL